MSKCAFTLLLLIVFFPMSADSDPEHRRGTPEHADCSRLLGTLKADPSTAPLVRTLMGYPLQLETVGRDQRGVQIVFAHRQEFTDPVTAISLSGLHSRRWSIRVEGYYALWRPEEPVSQSVRNYLDRHRFFSVTGEKGREYLIPVKEYLQIPDTPANGTRNWEVDVPARVPVSTVQTGVVTTASGTSYVFHKDGSLDVYSRTGKVTRHQFGYGPTDAPHGSHAAILLRQGFSRSEVRGNDRDNLRTAIGANKRQIDDTIRRKGIDPSVPGRYANQLERFLRLYSDGQDLSAKIAAVRDALRNTISTPKFLPSSFSWYGVDAAQFQTAPQSDSGSVIRILRPFIFFRHVGGLDSIRVLPTQESAMHLQTVHAHLGNLGLRLAEDGWISGGALVYEYDPSTLKLSKIYVDPTAAAIVGLSDERSHALTPLEITGINREVSVR